MMRRQQIRFVVLLGAISIIGILCAQSYFLLEAWTIKEKQVNQTLVIALKAVAEKLSYLNQSALANGNPVSQRSSNYFIVDVNGDIDANVLEYYLTSEFEKLNIRMDYEYAIYDCHTDSMVYGNYVSTTGTREPLKIGNTLPKYHDYLYYFGVRFPGLRNTVAGDMTLLFFFSLILLVSVVFFVYAIFVILRQKRFSELQRDFINNMTHEFKTPISTIQISADVITHPDIVQDPSRLSTYGAFIRQENQRLNLMVDKVLQIARIEKGTGPLKLERIDLNSLIQAVAETFRSDVRPGVSLQLMLDPAVGQVSADILHLTNILHNLTDNALKYAVDNPEIRIETRAIRDKVRISFSDHGPGIDPKYHKRIFQKFFRIPSGNVHDVKGFGLGLYYVKIMCKAHRWTIRAESNHPSGLTIIIELPSK